MRRGVRDDMGRSKNQVIYPRKEVLAVLRTLEEFVGSLDHIGSASYDMTGLEHNAGKTRAGLVVAAEYDRIVALGQPEVGHGPLQPSYPSDQPHESASGKKPGKAGAQTFRLGRRPPTQPAMKRHFSRTDLFTARDR